MTLTFDLVVRISIESGAYLSYSFGRNFPNLVCECIFGWSGVSYHFGSL